MRRSHGVLIYLACAPLCRGGHGQVTLLVEVQRLGGGRDDVFRAAHHLIGRRCKSEDHYVVQRSEDHSRVCRKGGRGLFQRLAHAFKTGLDALDLGRGCLDGRRRGSNVYVPHSHTSHLPLKTGGLADALHGVAGRGRGGGGGVVVGAQGGADQGDDGFDFVGR